MWKVKTEVGYYTVYFCPKCKHQRTWHTIFYYKFYLKEIRKMMEDFIMKCDICGLNMKYDYKTGRLKL